MNGGQTITPNYSLPQMPTSYPSTSSVPSSLIIVNILWFTSLMFSLIAASIGILLKQWLREYVNDRNVDAEKNLRIRNLRYHEGLQDWKVQEIVMLLPVLLQLALIIFLVGLVQFAWTLNTWVAIMITTITFLFLTFISITTILPTCSVTCPYKSPQAQMFSTSLLWMRARCSRDNQPVDPRTSSAEPVKKKTFIRTVWRALTRGWHIPLKWEERELDCVERMKVALDERIPEAVTSAHPMSWDESLSLLGPIYVRIITGMNSKEIPIVRIQRL